jgi:biopolymer transport protein ExbB
MLYSRDGGAATRDAAAEVVSQAQVAPSTDQQRRLAEAERLATETLTGQNKPAPQAAKPPPVDPSVWELYQKGGVLMYPITALSLVVVCFGFERFFGLRRRRVVPGRLVRGLREALAQAGRIDVAMIDQLCHRFPSAASRVIQDMLFNPDCAEVDMDRVAKESCEREATRLYFNVRWLNLAMSVAPMLGLLGTVQGMIIVFMGASHLPAGVNKAEYMAQGIYLKLVCTFAGLIVAIPAAVLSYLFEARIQKLMGEVEDLSTSVLRKVQRGRDFQSGASLWR